MMIDENQNIISTKVLYTSLFVNIFTYFILYFQDDYRTNIVNYFLIILPAYISYFIIAFYSLKHKTSTKIDIILILIVGFLIRTILVPSNPILSDDVFRYLWDGKVFSNGFNPFAYPPASSVLEGLRDTAIYPSINFKDIPTVYPPMAQIVFAVSFVIGYNIIVWKIVLFIFEGLLVFFLYKLLIHFKMNGLRLSIYFLNPLVIIETYSSGHMEVIAVCSFIIGIYYFYKNKTILSISMFVLSILTKYNPSIMILVFLKKGFIKKILLVFGAIILALIPFALNGSVPTAGMISFANRWEFNGFIYKMFLFIYDLFGFESSKWFSFAYNGRVEDLYLTGAFFYKLLAVLVLLIMLVDQFKKLKMTENFKGINYLQPVLLMGSAMLLLSPTLYPWYLIWIIPLLIFLPNWSWLLFTMLIQLSYFVLQGYATDGIWEESSMILWMQYLPFYGLLIFEYLDKRKIKGWFL